MYILIEHIFMYYKYRISINVVKRTRLYAMSLNYLTFLMFHIIVYTTY
jgi:hypothetical protein